jgi:N-acetylneuraminic acid mutarotase
MQQRDEHTAVVDKETGQMVVFGGFCQGTRTNETAIYNFAGSSWSSVKLPRGEHAPCPRSGHSASVFNGQMFVFGGKNEDSEKLNDLWCFKIAD